MGDVVKIGSNVEGIVEEVGFWMSWVCTYYNLVMIVFNVFVINLIVDNMGMC